MSTNAPKPANRRPLPNARSSAAGYEIVFPRPPRAAATISALFGFVRDAWGRSGETVGDAYAASARVVLDRKEALEDLNAERRHRARATAGRERLTAQTSADADPKTGS